MAGRPAKPAPAWYALVTAICGLACVSPEIPFSLATPFDPASSTLLPDYGILVVHIDSTLPIDRLQFSGGIAAEGLDRGSHVRFVMAPQGHHEWTEIRVVRGKDVLFFNTDAAADQAYFGFDIEPGVLNYPGQIRANDRSLRIVNRSAFLLETLERDHRDVLDRYPIRFAGRIPDSFLAEYGRVRAKRARGAPGDEPR